MQRATRSQTIIFLACLGVWLLVTASFIGLRPEHSVLAVLLSLAYFSHPYSRRLIVAMVPFMLFGISYDWMNLLPNYKVNPVDIQGLYEAEKAWFGITTAGGILTPNEFFQQHHWLVADLLSGFFYLCWVPVPIAFGIGLFFSGQETICRRFAWAFLVVNLIGFCGYYLHPAAPPWYVMNHGFQFIEGTPGEVAGLGQFDELLGISIFHSLYARNANVFAAVPSLHSAYMVVTFYYSLQARCPQWLRVIFFVIMLGIWFTAVYTSHHYCIDALLGICCAGLGTIVVERLSHHKINH